MPPKHQSFKVQTKFRTAVRNVDQIVTLFLCCFWTQLNIESSNLFGNVYENMYNILTVSVLAAPRKAPLSIKATALSSSSANVTWQVRKKKHKKVYSKYKMNRLS